MRRPGRLRSGPTGGLAEAPGSPEPSLSLALCGLGSTIPEPK